MKMKWWRWLGLVTIIGFSSGCATSSTVSSKISLGMTKQAVIAACGKPFRSGSRMGENGRAVEAITYQETLYRPFQYPNTETLYTNVYFVDGKVVQYGASEDWQTPDSSVEIIHKER